MQDQFGAFTGGIEGLSQLIRGNRGLGFVSVMQHNHDRTSAKHNQGFFRWGTCADRPITPRKYRNGERLQCGRTYPLPLKLDIWPDLAPASNVLSTFLLICRIDRYRFKVGTSCTQARSTGVFIHDTAEARISPYILTASDIMYLALNRSFVIYMLYVL